MSNTEQMVSVPCSLLEEACNGLRITQERTRKELRDLLAQPADQHQGEPVAFYREFVDGREYCEKPFTNDWTPLYIHADAGEVERLRRELEGTISECQRRRNSCAVLIAECDTLRASLESVRTSRDAYAQNAIDLRESMRRARKAHGESQGLMQEQIDTLRCQLAGLDSLLRRCLLAVREQHCDEGEADFDLPAPLLSDIDAALSAQVRPAEAGELERLRAALKFYADREHYHFESGNWDTVSGEPLNILWCGDEPDFIEDGSVARAAISASAEPEVKS